MPRVPRLDLVHKAIATGHRGQIEWKDACLARFRGDPEMLSLTEKAVKELLWNFVRNLGGKLEAREEKTGHWIEENPEDPWWYFAIIPIAEFKDGLFVKVKLLWEDGDSEDDAWVQIVSIHEEKRL